MKILLDVIEIIVHLQVQYSEYTTAFVFLKGTSNNNNYYNNYNYNNWFYSAKVCCKESSQATL